MNNLLLILLISFGNIINCAQMSDQKALNILNCKEVMNLQAYEGSIDLAWSPDGTKLASICYDEEMLQIWDIKSGEKIIEKNYDLDIFLETYSHHDGRLLSWSTDSKKLIFYYCKNLIVWDIEYEYKLETHNFEDASLISLSPDFTKIASAQEGTVTIWNAYTMEKLNTFSNDINESNPPIYALSWSADSSSIVAGLGKFFGSMKVWNINTGICKLEIGGNAFYKSALDWSKQRKQIAATNDYKFLKIFDIKEDSEIDIISDHTKTVNCLKWSPNSKFIATGSVDKTVRIFNMQALLNREDFKRRCNSSELIILNSHKEQIESLAWSPNNKKLASVSCDGNIKIWKICK